MDINFIGQASSGNAAFRARSNLVADADVRERTANHDLMVAAAGAVGVEVLLLDAMLDQVFAGRTSRRGCCPQGRYGPLLRNRPAAGAFWQP